MNKNIIMLLVMLAGSIPIAFSVKLVKFGCILVMFCLASVYGVGC